MKSTMRSIAYRLRRADATLPVSSNPGSLVRAKPVLVRPDQSTAQNRLSIGKRLTQRLPTFLVGYLVALLSVALATGLTFAILQTTGFRAAIGYAYLFAILISAWLGYGPGLLACGLGFFVVPYIFDSSEESVGRFRLR